jgi:hypothetical protein
VTQFEPLPRIELPYLSSRIHEDAIIGRCELADFEAWVESSLSD